MALLYLDQKRPPLSHVCLLTVTAALRDQARPEFSIVIGTPQERENLAQSVEEKSSEREARRRNRLSRRSVLEKNSFDVCQPELAGPGQGSRPRLVIGQVRRGAVIEQELDHFSLALGQF